MKYLKLFSTQNQYQSYIENNWISPHIYKIQENKKVDYEDKYVPLEYIRSTETGGQYIDLGIGLFDVSPINFRIIMHWMLYGHGKTGLQQSTLLCAAKEASQYPGLNIRIPKNTYSYYNECCYKQLQNYEDEFSKDGRYYCGIYDINNNALTYGPPDSGKYVDSRNILVHFNREFNFTDEQLHNVTTSLFCSKNSSGNPQRYINARIDYCKLYKNGILVRDLVPVLNKQNIPGLYDKLNRKFYRSQGDTDFVAGPIIN